MGCGQAQSLTGPLPSNRLVADHGFRRVILVTSDYHVPRAHFALRAVLPPEVEISVFPVRSDWKDRAALPRTLKHFFVEGWKYWGYRFFLWTAVAIAATVLGGFWFTYFGPIIAGERERDALAVHLHGWSFFAWYALLVVQSALSLLAPGHAPGCSGVRSASHRRACNAGPG